MLKLANDLNSKGLLQPEEFNWLKKQQTDNDNALNILLQAYIVNFPEEVKLEYLKRTKDKSIYGLRERALPLPGQGIPTSFNIDENQLKQIIEENISLANSLSMNKLITEEQNQQLQKAIIEKQIVERFDVVDAAIKLKK